MNTSEMDAELEPYQFLQTYYNKKTFALSNDKTTASSIGKHQFAYLATTRPIGREHRLILKILGLEQTDICLMFTTCDTASLLANDKHLTQWCGAGCCTGRLVSRVMYITTGSQMTVRRKTDNMIEVVVIDASGGSSTELWDTDVAADVPVVPVMCFRKIWQNIQILPDETGLRTILSQFLIVKQKCHKENEDDLRSVVQSTTSKLSQRIQRQEEKMQFMQPQVSRIEQHILSVRTEYFALKSDHQQKTQFLELAIGLQSDLINSLINQVAQMKAGIGSPPAACLEADSSSTWISNDGVAVRNGVMHRIGDMDSKNYSFRSTTFATGTKITFVISRVSKQIGGSLTFGVTVISPHHLDMQSLPANGVKLEKSRTENWHVANNFVSKPNEKQIICLMRTSDGVLMKTETELWTIEERILFPVDPFLRLYPFFLFDGCVEEIEQREFKVRKRDKLECVICLDKPASTRVKPCGHILYCEDCRSGAIICRDDSNCPLCGEVIVKYKQIRTD